MNIPKHVDAVASLQDGTQLARQRILLELVDALIQEDLFALQSRSLLIATTKHYRDVPGFSLADGEYYLRYPLKKPGDELVCRVRQQQQVQPYRLSRLPLLMIRGGNSRHCKKLDAVRLMQYLVEEADEAVLPDTSGLGRFMRDLKIAEAQTAIALEAQTELLLKAISEKPAGRPGCKASLRTWEALAALRDRPFHPLARAKNGWSTNEYRRYGAEHGQVFTLDWLALRNDRVLGNSKLTGKTLARILLNADEQKVVAEALESQGITPDNYTLLPVHPWQMRHVINKEFIDEFKNGDCVVIAESLGRFISTSSIRSLIPVHEGEDTGRLGSERELHVKLPVAIGSLGALRILPPRYLHNGAIAQAVLSSIISRKPVLAESVFLCDESQWIGFIPKAENSLSNRAGHLSCLLRRYPDCSASSVSATRGRSLLPMSALAVAQGDTVPALEWLATGRLASNSDGTAGEQLILRIFEQICEHLTALCMVCFDNGVMPEVHGQNVVLVVEGGGIVGLLLRDHDTLRVFPPWMKEAGLGEVDYLMDWSTPNSLICLSPQELLRYFQTLGVQVNLYAIADTLAQTYAINLGLFWEIIKTIFEQQLQSLPLTTFSKAYLRKELIDSPTWPTRLLLTPYLVRRAQETGMPSGTGSTRNPLHSG